MRTHLIICLISILSIPNQATNLRADEDKEIAEAICEGSMILPDEANNDIRCVVEHENNEGYYQFVESSWVTAISSVLGIVGITSNALGREKCSDFVSVGGSIANVVGTLSGVVGSSILIIKHAYAKTPDETTYSLGPCQLKIEADHLVTEAISTKTIYSDMEPDWEDMETHTGVWMLAGFQMAFSLLNIGVNAWTMDHDGNDHIPVLMIPLGGMLTAAAIAIATDSTD